MLLETRILCKQFKRLAKDRYGLLILFLALPYVAYKFNRLRENLIEHDVFIME